MTTIRLTELRQHIPKVVHNALYSKNTKKHQTFAGTFFTGFCLRNFSSSAMSSGDLQQPGNITHNMTN